MWRAHVGQLDGPLSMLTSLETLELTKSGINGTLPMIWSLSFQSMVHLNVSQNMLSGTLPPGQCNLACAESSLVLCHGNGRML